MDRVTQLQDTVNNLGSQICNAIGLIQQSAPPKPLTNPNTGEQEQNEMTSSEFSTAEIDNSRYIEGFSDIICKLASDVRILIDSMPNVTPGIVKERLDVMRVLEQQSTQAGKHLQSSIDLAEYLLDQVNNRITLATSIITNASDCLADDAHDWNIDGGASMNDSKDSKDSRDNSLPALTDSF